MNHLLWSLDSVSCEILQAFILIALSILYVTVMLNKLNDHAFPADVDVKTFITKINLSNISSTLCDLL